ncbi:hypothetical protein MIR68_000591 [Amoeboaphelidium protococcarum]|nr:hypothetical protein MIR68_000591 [Amoeboaphelidium protococcarum]
MGIQTLLVITILSVLELLNLVAGSLYTKADAVIELNQYNFEKKVLSSVEVWIVEFYAPWCGHCQRLAPEYKKAAGNLKGIVHFGAIDCDQEVNKPLCGRYGIQGFPTIKIFPASVKDGKASGNKGDKKAPKQQQQQKIAVDYQGQRTAKALVEAAVARLPSKFVERIIGSSSSSSASASKKSGKSMEEFFSINNSTSPKVILFTDKVQVSPLYKSLSLRFSQQFVFGQVNGKKFADLQQQFGISILPSLIIIGLDGQVSVYNGTLKATDLRKYLYTFSKAQSKVSNSSNGAQSEDDNVDNDNNDGDSDSGEDDANKKDVEQEDFVPQVSQITSQVDFEKHCVQTTNAPSALCMVVHMPVLEADVPESVQQHQDLILLLEQVKAGLHKLKDTKQFPKTEIMWTFGNTESVQKNIINKFGLASDLPTAFVIKPSKKVYKPYIGAFDAKSLVDWIVKDLTSSRSKVYPYTFEVDFGVESDADSDKISGGKSCSAQKDDGGSCKASHGKEELPGSKSKIEHEEL